VETKLRECSLDKSNVLENCKLKVRSLHEEHKIEVSCLKRQNAELESQVQRLKTQVVQLEATIDAKDKKLEELKTDRFVFPDSGAIENVKLLEQEVCASSECP